jgi:hypothetical protein
MQFDTFLHRHTLLNNTAGRIVGGVEQFITITHTFTRRGIHFSTNARVADHHGFIGAPLTLARSRHFRGVADGGQCGLGSSMTIGTRMVTIVVKVGRNTEAATHKRHHFRPM